MAGPRRAKAGSRTHEDDDVSASLRAQLTGFLDFLALNRAVSPHTVRAYESDLSQFLSHVAAGSGRRRADLGCAPSRATCGAKASSTAIRPRSSRRRGWSGASRSTSASTR
jgi:integrase/recombinase XerC